MLTRAELLQLSRDLNDCLLERDLGADDLSKLELLMALEEFFDIEELDVDLDETPDVKVHEIIKLVRSDKQ